MLSPTIRKLLSAMIPTILVQLDPNTRLAQLTNGQKSKLVYFDKAEVLFSNRPNCWKTEQNG